MNIRFIVSCLASKHARASGNVAKERGKMESSEILKFMTVY